MRSRWFVLVALLTLANFSVLAQGPKPRIDRIFVNGKSGREMTLSRKPKPWP